LKFFCGKRADAGCCQCSNNQQDQNYEKLGTGCAGRHSSLSCGWIVPANRIEVVYRIVGIKVNCQLFGCNFEEGFSPNAGRLFHVK
jgi:hypothetical protein